MAHLRWYIVHVHAGCENKVSQSIKEQAQKKKLEDHIQEVLVPTENIVEIKKGEKVKKERNFFPGYILIRMILTDETWHMIKNENKVTGFLGGSGKPSPISEKEVKRILNQVEELQEKALSKTVFEVGEQVKVVDGPFNSFSGYVEEHDPDKQRLKVAVTIFGRSTPIDLNYHQVEKLS